MAEVYNNHREQKEYPDSFKDFEDILSYMNRTRCNDGDWITEAMELGLVGDVVTFYMDMDEVEKSRDFKDHNGITHRIFNFGKIRDLLGHHGVLVDDFRGDEQTSLWKALNWTISKGWQSNKNNLKQIWFDIDLDFAVHEIRGFASMPWRLIDFINEFGKYVDNDSSPYCTVGGMIDALIKNSSLVTIATEPKFSCGYQGIAHILKCMDLVFQEPRWFEELNKSGDIPRV